MKYDLNAIEMLNCLGFREPVGREMLEELREALQRPLPEVYEAFLEVAADCPVLETGDVWCGDGILSHLREQQKNGAAEYLEIGSDFGAGIVTFGLRMADLDKADPPVYLLHEADEPEQKWRDAYPSLSVFLLDVMLTALTMVMYGTAEEALEERGWVYTDYFMECMEAADSEDGNDEEEAAVTEETLVKKGIDPKKVRWHECSYGGRFFCCYDEEREIFYTGCWDGNEENTLYTISRLESGAGGA